MMLAGKKVLLAVCGSIAAYKSVLLLRLLKEAGAEVRVLMTEAAQKFVTPLTFYTLSGEPVFTDLWSEAGGGSQHVHLALWAELIVVAPITAHSLAKMANGCCDDVLSAVYLSAKSPVMVCPAMDRDMILHPAVVQNINTLKKRELIVIESGTGYLASGLTGQGRLAEPQEILKEICFFFAEKDLKRKKILITAGPTQESIDPVRYLTNHSTGKMGIAIADRAVLRGADVTLILGPTEVKPEYLSKYKNVINVRTAQEMFDETENICSETEIFIFTAAVSDFRPVNYAEQKIKKQNLSLTDETFLNIELTTNPDILAHVGKNKSDNQKVIGFALETHDGENYARQKLTSKNADLIALNTYSKEGTGFGHNTNRLTLFGADGTVTPLPFTSKTETADLLLTFIKEKFLS